MEVSTIRLLNRNKQKMYLSNIVGTIDIVDDYEDSYVDRDGNIYYPNVHTEDLYSIPSEFYANIKSTLNEAQSASYGVDQSSIYSKILTDKNKYDIKIGTYIWKKSKVKYKDALESIPDIGSADYKVVGILDEFINEDLFLLKRLTKETFDENLFLLKRLTKETFDEN